MISSSVMYLTLTSTSGFESSKFESLSGPSGFLAALTFNFNFPSEKYIRALKCAKIPFKLSKTGVEVFITKFP